MGISSSFVKSGWFTPPPPLFTIHATNSGSPFGGFNGAVIRMYGDSTYNTSWASWYPGSGDFCIESWININSNSSTVSTLWGLFTGGRDDSYAQFADVGLAISNTSLTYGSDSNHRILVGALQGVTGGNGNIFNDGTDPLNPSCFITPGVWTHVAMSRSANTVYLWVNGVLSYSYSYSGNIVNSNPSGAMISLFGGQAYNQYTDGGTAPWNYTGDIRNIRYTVGNPVYTSAFTPPPLREFLMPLSGTYFKMSPSPVANDVSFDSSNYINGRNPTNECTGPYNYQMIGASGRADGSGSGPTPGFANFYP